MSDQVLELLREKALLEGEVRRLRSAEEEASALSHLRLASTTEQEDKFHRIREALEVATQALEAKPSEVRFLLATLGFWFLPCASQVPAFYETLQTLKEIHKARQEAEGGGEGRSCQLCEFFKQQSNTRRRLLLQLLRLFRMGPDLQEGLVAFEAGEKILLKAEARHVCGVLRRLLEAHSEQEGKTVEAEKNQDALRAPARGAFAAQTVDVLFSAVRQIVPRLSMAQRETLRGVLEGRRETEELNEGTLFEPSSPLETIDSALDDATFAFSFGDAQASRGHLFSRSSKAASLALSQVGNRAVYVGVVCSCCSVRACLRQWLRSAVWEKLRQEAASP